jgi:hypothetical protein
MSVASSMPMGWGMPWQSFTDRLDDEARAREQIQKLAPAALMRHAAKEVLDTAVLAKTRELMAKDGMEDGFSFLHLHEAIFGKLPDWKPQLIGSCVASGDKETTSARMLAEVFLFQQAESLPGGFTSTTDNASFFAPFNYRAGRKLAGINGSGDGSLCLPHIRGKMQYGHLPCDAAGLASDDFPEPQNQSTYRQWGASDRFLNDFAAAAGKYKLLESEKVRMPDEMWTLTVEHFKPANICSMWAFKRGPQHPTWKTRDGKPVHIWVRDTRQEWAHNMSRMGYIKLGGQRYGIVKNTWGPFHDGRSWFVIDEQTDESWLRQAECQTVGDIDMKDNSSVWPSFK